MKKQTVQNAVDSVKQSLVFQIFSIIAVFVTIAGITAFKPHNPLSSQLSSQRRSINHLLSELPPCPMYRIVYRGNEKKQILDEQTQILYNETIYLISYYKTCLQVFNKSKIRKFGSVDDLRSSFEKYWLDLDVFAHMSFQLMNIYSKLANEVLIYDTAEYKLFLLRCESYKLEASELMQIAEKEMSTALSDINNHTVSHSEMKDICNTFRNHEAITRYIDLTGVFFKGTLDVLNSYIDSVNDEHSLYHCTSVPILENDVDESQ